MSDIAALIFLLCVYVYLSTFYEKSLEVATDEIFVVSTNQFSALVSYILSLYKRVFFFF